MKVLLVHNHYRKASGEDVVVDLECNLLQERGHRVEQFTVSNEALATASFRIGIEAMWSQRSYKKLREIIRNRKPDVIHFHNTFPRLSPSVLWAAASKRIPVVQTLHNYRLTCAN